MGFLDLFYWSDVNKTYLKQKSDYSKMVICLTSKKFINK